MRDSKRSGAMPKKWTVDGAQITTADVCRRYNKSMSYVNANIRKYGTLQAVVDNLRGEACLLMSVAMKAFPYNHKRSCFGRVM